MGDKSGRKARRIKTNDKVSPSHPYLQYESEPIWPVVTRGIDDLVSNGDLEEKTPRPYIVGYLCKLLLNFENGNSGSLLSGSQECDDRSSEPVNTRDPKSSCPKRSTQQR